jgi:hypothetical protein
MSQPNAISCATCVYRHTYTINSVCRRNPPTALPGGNVWPKVGELDWCGEWQPKSEPMPIQPRRSLSL